MPNEDVDVVHFVIGSSLLVTLIPMIILHYGYSRLTAEEQDELRVSFPTMAIILPILTGTLFTLTYRILSSFTPRKVKNFYFRYIISGTCTAMLTSLIFDKCFDVYGQWFGITNVWSWHLFIGIIYTILFATTGVWLRIQILYGSSPTTTITSVSSPKPSMPAPTLPNVSNPPNLPKLNIKSNIYESMAKKAKTS